ncbi:MAG: FtsW/RodA/SpoVE family cell cycle protein, partial [Stellaceae bacterium]
MESFLDSSGSRQSLAVKLLAVNWGLLLLLCCIAGIGFAMLYSAANGHWQPWASKQMIRFVVAVLVMLAVAAVDLRFWLRWAYSIYGCTFLLLVAVELRGAVGMGAQR